MKLNKKYWTLLIALAIQNSIVGCGASVGDGASDGSENETTTMIIENKAVKIKTNLKCSKGTSLNYDNFGEGFLLNYCTSCHSSQVEVDDRIGAPENVDFDTPELAQIWRYNILKSLKDKKNPMPPNQDLSPLKLKQFNEWLNCGAPSGTDNL